MFLQLFWLLLQGFLRLVGTTDGAQERKFTGGSMQLAERLAAGLDPGRVRLGCPVVAIRQTPTTASNVGRKTTVVTSDGATFAADYVISAVPLALINRIQFVPPLPPLKIQLIQRVPMGSVIKTMTLYEKPFWRSKGYSGQLLVDDEAGLRVWTFDDTKPDGTAPCVLGFITGNHVRLVLTRQSQQFEIELTASMNWNLSIENHFSYNFYIFFTR